MIDYGLDQDFAFVDERLYLHKWPSLYLNQTQAVPFLISSLHFRVVMNMYSPVSEKVSSRRLLGGIL